MKTVRKVFMTFSNVLISFYFMMLLNTSTLTTNIQRTCVMLYFFVVLNIITYFLNAYLVKKQVMPKNSSLLISVLLTLSIVFLTGKIFIPSNHLENNISIFIQSDKNPDSQGFEARLAGVSIDNVNYSLSELDSSGSEWFFDGNVYFGDFSHNNIVLNLHLPKAKNIKLKFVKHAWSGIIEVKTNFSVEQYDLYDANGKEEIITVAVNKHPYAPAIKLLLYLGLILFIFYTFNYLVMFFSSMIIKKLELKLMKKQMVLIGIISIIISIQFLAYPLFLNTGTIVINPKKLLCFIISIIFVFFIVTEVILYLMSHTNIKLRKNQNNYKIFIAILSILIGVWLIALCIFYPGNISSDTTDQWLQATGYRPYNDWHPFFMTFIMSLLLKLNQSIVFLEVIQILYMALCYSFLLYELYIRGLSKKQVILTTFMFALFPGNFMAATSISKDAIFTSTLVYSCYLLYKISLSSEAFFKKTSNCISLIITFVMLYTMRHNGILPCFFITIYLLYINIKNHKLLKWKPITVIIVSIAMISFIYGPLFNNLNVGKNALSPYLTMFTADGACLSNGKTFSEESTEILESIIPLEAWKNNYNRFSSDSYLFAKVSPLNLSKITAKQAFRVYLEALFKYPHIVIQDRLDGMNILWNIFQPDESLNNSKWHYGIYNDTILGLKTFGININYSEPYYYIHNSIADLCNGIFNMFSYNKILDAIFWRSGIYFVLLFIFYIYSVVVHKNSINIMLIPFWGNTLSWILVLSFQAYRYIYYVQIIAFFYVAFCLTYPNKVQKKKGGTV